MKPAISFLTPSRNRRRSRAGFTLVEILLAAAITVVLVAILLRITTLATTTINLSTQRLSAFSSARAAFDIMTRNLSQATLNPYLDYYDASGNRRTNTNIGSFQPVSYGRASDLQFLIQANVQKATYGQEVYFQAPRAYSTDPNFQSVTGLLNACGYYVSFGSNVNYEPTAISALITAGKAAEKYRYRLMQGMEPTEQMKVFQATSVAAGGTTTDQSSVWLSNIQNPPTLGSAYATPLVDNVIALIVWPRLSAENDGPGLKLLPATYAYSYDSQASVTPAPTAPFAQGLTANQLPPDVQLTMVVLDEASAIRMAATASPATSPPATIETALSGKFATADQYSNDLANLATALSAQHLNFQFFSSTVAMRESKWTTPQP